MKVTVSGIVAAPVERVWALLDDFAAWHVWLDGIESTTMEDGLTQAPVGSVRMLTRSDGTTIRERLLTHDSVNYVVSYTFVGPHPYPVRRYVGTVRLEAVTTDGTTFLSWSGDYDGDAADAPSAEASFRRSYHAFLGFLRRAVDAGGESPTREGNVHDPQRA